MPATDGTVYLTNGSVSDPFVVFDTYDWRSVIENGIFKEGKHPWHLGKFPKKIEAAVVVHCHFTEAFHGAVYRLSLGASQAGGCSNRPDANLSQLEYRAAGRRGHGRLSLAAEARKIATRSSSLWGRPMAFSIWPNWPS